jgi:hypothetical protein
MGCCLSKRAAVGANNEDKDINLSALGSYSEGHELPMSKSEANGSTTSPNTDCTHDAESMPYVCSTGYLQFNDEHIISVPAPAHTTIYQMHAQGDLIEAESDNGNNFIPVQTQQSNHSREYSDQGSQTEFQQSGSYYAREISDPFIEHPFPTSRSGATAFPFSERATHNRSVTNSTIPEVRATSPGGTTIRSVQPTFGYDPRVQGRYYANLNAGTPVFGGELREGAECHWPLSDDPDHGTYGYHQSIFGDSDE